MATDVSKYAMESAYKDVERDALGRTLPQDSPRAVILGGQPGSGKSALAAEAVREFRLRGGAVVIDADRMREENPRYKQLSQVDPQHAADRTQKDAGEWATRLTIAAVDAHRNLVVDGTMRSPANLRDLSSRLKANGYEIEARVLAVHPEVSMTRARLRFEEQVAVRGTGRFVNSQQHDTAYMGLVDSVVVLERDQLVDAVRVYDSNQRPIYENRLLPEGWKKAPEVLKVVEQERSREWTHAERRDYVSALQDIELLGREREKSTGVVIGDADSLGAKLARARNDLEKFEQGALYQRAAAFDQMPKNDALARFPELEGAYRKLDHIKQSWTPQTSQNQRETSYFTARAELSQELHRGHVPKSADTVDESRKTIDAAALQRGLIVRDAQDIKRNVKGEVVAESSHHILVKVSEMIAVRYEKSSLDRDVHVGERLAVQYAQGKSQVYEQGKEPKQDRGDRGMQLER